MSRLTRLFYVPCFVCSTWKERMLIRQAVEAGRIDEAIRRTNELDPEVSLLS